MPWNKSMVWNGIQGLACSNVGWEDYRLGFSTYIFKIRQSLFVFLTRKSNVIQMNSQFPLISVVEWLVDMVFESRVIKQNLHLSLQTTHWAYYYSFSWIKYILKTSAIILLEVISFISGQLLSFGTVYEMWYCYGLFKSYITIQRRTLYVSYKFTLYFA